MILHERPEIEIPRMPEVHQDAATGLILRMSKSDNLLQRKETLKRCEVNPKFRAAVLKWCANSPIAWITLFGWTLNFWRIKESGLSASISDKIQPFIPWPAQIRLISRIHESIVKGETFLLEKSREIGASWIYLYCFTHQLLFRPNVHISILSRIENDVDMMAGDVKGYPFNINSDPSTLLGKVDFILQHLPQWMLPRFGRKRLHILNIDTKSRIDGGASATYAFSGQRRDAIYFDEAAKNEAFGTIWESTSDVALCRLPCSTHVGASTYFNKLRRSSQIPVESFGWWLSPEKAFDLEVQEIQPGEWKLTSSWYRTQVAQRSPNDVAMNLDMDALESGSPFFESYVLETYRKNNARPPLLKLKIEFEKGIPESEIRGIVLRRDLKKVRVVQDPKGPWSLWVYPSITNVNSPVDSYNKLYGADVQFCIGIDISQGMGASNSAASVINRRTRHKIAEYTHSRKPPHAFAKDMAAAAIWFGSGAVRPLCVPETNGTVGVDFMRQFSHIYGYPELYRRKTIGRSIEKQSDNLGFHSSRPNKAALLGNLRREYSVGKFLNHSEMSIKEAMDYIISETGAIEPAFLSEESENIKASHGDRVIADALALWPGSENELPEDKVKPKSTLDGIENSPWGSQGQRIRDKAYIRFQTGKRISEVKMGDKIKLSDYM